MKNIKQVAVYIDSLRNKEKVKAALEAMLPPCSDDTLVVFRSLMRKCDAVGKGEEARQYLRACTALEASDHQ